MSDVSKPREPMRWFSLAGAIGCAGLFWLADGRLWPSIAGNEPVLRNGWWLFMTANIVMGSWIFRTWWTRAIGMVLSGAALWFCGNYLAWAVSNGSSALIAAMVLGYGFLLLAGWGLSRMPATWLEKAMSFKAGYVYAGLVFIIAVAQAAFALKSGQLDATAFAVRVGLVTAGLTIALAILFACERLKGWARLFICFSTLAGGWVVGGACLVLGSGVGGSLGDWALMIAPPIIAGAVLVAYWRIDVTSRAAA